MTDLSLLNKNIDYIIKIGQINLIEKHGIVFYFEFSFRFQSILRCFRVWVDFENKYFQSQTLKWQWTNDEMKILLREQTGWRQKGLPIKVDVSK